MSRLLQSSALRLAAVQSPEKSPTSQLRVQGLSGERPHPFHRPIRKSAAFSPRGLCSALALAVVFATGCAHHHKPVQVSQQQTAPPPIAYPPPTAQSQPPARIPVTPVPPGGVSDADLDFVNTHRPILSETGLATWYTAPYKGRKAANGEVFNDEAFTAAHRTLPMGSLVVVTNLRTGQSAAMRITDRGPFVDGRILDLTIASAKATGIYRAGTAQVRLDVYQTPKPIHTGGRWCVQIGAFKSEHDAERLKSELLRRFPTSNVIEFPGQDSYWVRIRPEGDNREQAEFIAHHIPPGDAPADAFLTRLD
jgi:rare lipoprotein A